MLKFVWNRLRGIKSSGMIIRTSTMSRGLLNVTIRLVQHLSFFSFMSRQGGLPHFRGFKITLRYSTLGMTPLVEWSARRRDLYLTTHNTHTLYALDGIRTRNSSNLTAVDPLLRPRGLFDYVRLFISSSEQSFSTALNGNIILNAEFMGRIFALKTKTEFSPKRRNLSTMLHYIIW